MVVCGSNHTAFLLKYEVHSDEYFTDKERGISGSRMLPQWGQLFPGVASIRLNECRRDRSILHNGENDSHKRQFLALGVHSQYWILDNLSKKKSCQIDWCYKLLATI